MRKNSETIADDNNIEILVAYAYDQSKSQTEEGHGYHEVGEMVYTELTSVEVVIKGKGIDILPLMNERQKLAIIDKLQYE